MLRLALLRAAHRCALNSSIRAAKAPLAAPLSYRYLSQVAQPAQPAGARPVGAQGSVDTQVGTVSPHRYHLVVCNSSPDEWPSKVEGLSETISHLARGSVRLPGRAMVTLSDFSPLQSNSCGGSCSCGSASSPPAGKYDRIDVAVFPVGIVAKQLDVSGVQKLLEWLSHDILLTSWSASNTQLPRPQFEHSWLELTRNRHIFVCTHGSRDRLCGTHGAQLLKDLRSLIAERNLGKHCAAWSTSHIGGHKYAANAIVYPRGDWYGTWCDRCGGKGPRQDTSANDAQSILDAATRDVVWWDAWRGAISMSKSEQVATWARSKGGGASTDPGSAGLDAVNSWTPSIRKRS